MHAPAGILLPQSVLTSSWFILMATVVAFNTIIYIGLTLSKLIPMPRQFHPDRVRRLLRRLGFDPDKDATMDDIPRPEAPETDDPYENIRREIARRDIPQAFGLVGGLVIALSVAAIAAFHSSGITFQLVEIGVGVIFLLVAQVLGRTHTKARAVMWTWALGCVVIVAMLAAEAIRVNEQLPLAYSLIVMTAFPPIALAWRPSIVAGLLMLVIVCVTVIIVDGTESGRLLAAAVSALLVGAILLRLRLKAIDALADEQARSAALVSTDVLTGVLSRHGLLTLMTGLAGTAERLGESVCVMYFDVQHLAKANEQYGSIYGDDVLRAVADAIKEHVRLGDLVARWGGDEFLVAGLGGKPNGEQLALRIQEAVRVSGVNLGKWPTQVRIGVAAGDPRTTTFDQIVAEATAELTRA